MIFGVCCFFDASFFFVSLSDGRCDDSCSDKEIADGVIVGELDEDSSSCSGGGFDGGVSRITLFSEFIRFFFPSVLALLLLNHSRVLSHPS